MSDTAPAIAPEAVHEFVRMAHGGLEETRAMLDGVPTLVNAAWDWGNGDWETALGAAAHMGRRDIATLLLERGARIDLFAAAMLGHIEIVRAVLDAFPVMRGAVGPHGIPLIDHARKGGPEARAVVELLQDDDRVVARGQHPRSGKRG